MFKKTLDIFLSIFVMATATSNFVATLANAGLNAYKIDVIDFNARELATVLAPFINQGSRPHFLTRDDLKVYKVKYKTASTVPMADRIDENSDFNTFMKIGNNKFFDVLFYLSLDDADRPRLLEVAEGSTLPPATSGSICTALFVQYFFILTRGRVSGATTSAQGTDMPKFLKVVLNCTESPKDYMDLISSFDMHKMGYEWARHVPFGGMSREAVSRFGLGVAGYRMFAPFRMLQPRTGITPNLQRAVEIARQMATADASWDLHPATRTNAILQTYGPLNANLGNLMLEVFEQADLQQLVTTKALFQMPTDDPSARHYKTWNVDYTPNNTAKIFP
jgi:hypothetical protein